MRYDPLYRVIEETEEMCIIEGAFKPMFDRLKKINNLGIIPEVFGMARYPKYEHGIGTFHQISRLLKITDDKVIPARYRIPLNISTIFLHSGHLPFTYSTERALLLACNLGKEDDQNNVSEYICKKVNKVLDKAGYEEGSKEGILKDLLSMKEYKSLYRYFSCENLIEKWSKLKSKLKIDDDECLKIIIRNLIEKKSDGYKYLNLANKADYVQRDALYFGTVKIDISPEHLYRETSVYNPRFSVSEEKLIESNLQYLDERFYGHDEVVFFSRLYEKILASLIISKNFKFQWFEEYNDDQFKRLITENLDKNNNYAKLPPEWIKKARDLFDNKVKFSSVLHLKAIPFPKKKNIIDIEYELLKRNKSERGLLHYPYETGILLNIDYFHEEEFIPNPNNSLYSISIYQDESKKKLIELLKIIKNLTIQLSVFDIEEVRKSLGKEFSWTKDIRYDNKAIVESIAEAILSIEKNESEKGKFVSDYLDSLVEIQKFKVFWNNFETRFNWKEPIAYLVKKQSDEENNFEIYQHFVRGLLSLPVELLQFKSTKKYLDKIYQMLLENISIENSNEKKGNLFESLWLIDKLRSKRGDFQFFLNGMVVIDPEKIKKEQDENEFDVIELIITGKSAECWIYACSIADDYKTKNEAQITKLADNIHDVFPDVNISTRYVIPEKRNYIWTPKELNTGRNYV